LCDLVELMKCFCCSGKEYEDCCQPYIDLKKIADTAEQLMRSRYSAYVLKEQFYLRESWVKDQCPAEFELDDGTKWVRLEVVSTEKGQQEDGTGKVEFRAYFVQQDKLFCVHEISDFQRYSDRWLYYSGELIAEPVVSLSMSQSCPCGSGKKYKRCCR